MKVWVLHTYGSGVGDDVLVEVFATWEKAYTRWKQCRDADVESFDDPDITEDENRWEEYSSSVDKYAKYSYDSDNGWVHVEVQKLNVQGLEGRNKI